MKSLLTTLALILVSAPAMALHVYSSYECKSADGKLELKYDGPGSNYSAGGFSHFYVAPAQAGRGALAFETFGDDGVSIRQEVGGEMVSALFSVVSSERLTEPTSSLRTGDVCQPGDVEYNHENWTSKWTVRIEDSSRFGRSIGLRTGKTIDFECKQSMDIPVDCSENGTDEP